MAQITRSTKVNGTTSLAASTRARAQDIEVDIALLFSTHNSYDSAASSWTALKAAGSSTVPLSIDNLTGTQNIAEFKDNGTNVWHIADGGNLVSATKKITGLAAGTTAGDAVRYEQALLLDGGGTLTSGSIAFTDYSTQGITGTATNNAAAAGKVGQYIESIAASTNFPSTTTFGDLTSISLTAGDWDVTAFGYAEVASGTWTVARVGISSTTGNSSSGLTLGTNEALQSCNPANAMVNIPLVVPSFRVSLASTTTYYMKFSATYSAGQPVCRGRISARRVR